MKNIIDTVRKKLIANIDEKTKASSQRFFKEQIKCYGVKVPLVHKISKELFAPLKQVQKNEVFQLCELLWQSEYLEESFVACNWSFYVNKLYTPEDFATFEKWIDNYINNWASCDTFCNHSVGTFIEMYPEYIEKLKQFATSENLWVRRAAAVSLIVPARKGMFLADIFEIADILLNDEEDLIQKGYGWMLKVASQTHQRSVFEFIMQRKATMPRTSLRYAIEKMPEVMKKEAMKK